MTDLINGRTPEDIKRILEWISFACGNLDCDHCQYNDICCPQNGRDDIVARDALALIERLEAKVPRWISVEDRLPPKDTNVLVFATEKIKGFGEAIAICEYSETLTMFGNNTGRYDWSSPWEYFHVDYKITHWMPLPKPIKENEINKEQCE